MRINRKMIKSLIPGLLPLFVFVLADELWGSVIGLYVALGFGVLELMINYFKSGKIEKFILLDLGLLLLLGSISILLKDEIFFKLKPALIEVIFAAILGFSIFSSRNIIFEMSERYLKGVTLQPASEKKFNKNLRIIFGLTLLHVGLVIYSSYYMSKEAWAFISGILIYIMIFGYFGIEFLINRLRSNNSEIHEMLPVVDEEGNVVGKAAREECHFNPSKKILHPVVHLQVLNSEGEVYLQHRAMTKKVQPGKWDTAVGGHISFGENLELSLFREAKEEIGLSDFQPKFVRKYLWETDVEKELVFTFICETEASLITNPEEISEGRFWPMDEIRSKLGKGIFTNNFEKEFFMLWGIDSKNH